MLVSIDLLYQYMENIYFILTAEYDVMKHVTFLYLKHTLHSSFEKKDLSKELCSILKIELCL
jgi:hypothetical protein